jgi:hypothetical protein
LQLKICDVACGSGHILLSAARRVALEIARIQTEEEQPNPLAIRKAMKDVVRNCIYGVDKNPLAVELCKIALWLEAYNPGEPLNFLDHHIKCGDAIVGLAHRNELENGIPDEAFKTLSGDDKDIAKSYRDKNVRERKERAAKASQLKADFEKATHDTLQTTNEEFSAFNNMPENTPEEIESKVEAYKSFIEGEGLNFLKAMADTKVAQFFIPKTDENKDVLMTDGDFRLILNGQKDWQEGKVVKAKAVAIEERIFHWFIEFPEVFTNGGFDCILGNPPYLGGTKISTFNGDNYFNFCKSNYFPAAGRCDLVGYFIRRIFLIQKQNGFHSIITTNTIAEGDTREGGFDIILKNEGRIIYAEKGVVWPGKANVIVTLYSIYKGIWDRKYLLSKKSVSCITPYLTEDAFVTTPFCIKENAKKAFMGSSITGDGFLIDNTTHESLINDNPNYDDVIFKYVNGSDFNNLPIHLSEKRIINFFDSGLLEIKQKYPSAVDIVERYVKPEREKKSEEVASAPWWKYWRIREELYTKISENKQVLVLTRATSTHGFAFLKNEKLVYSDAVVVFIFDSFIEYSILQSTFHEDWAWRFSSRLKNDRRYSVTDAFETFPFPQNLNEIQEIKLESSGKNYHEHRRLLMLEMQLGLTKIYNLFHSIAITINTFNPEDKDLVSLKKYLEKTFATISLDDAIQGIFKLRQLHIKMDDAVLEAYSWNDIELQHNFYEVDYLPENDRVRFTIHPEARKEVLKRLLDLNHKIHEEECQCEINNPIPKKKSKSAKVKNQDQSELF